MFQAAFQTLNHVVKNASDSESKSTALGLIANITSPKFIILLAAFKQVLASVNIVSLFLQAKQIDIAAALEKIQTLKEELRQFRTSRGHWEECMARAKTLAQCVEKT